MNLYQDTSGIDKVVDSAVKISNTVNKVVDIFANIGSAGEKVGKMKTSAKIGLLIGSAAVLSLFPLRLAYDSKTGEGEYQSLVVHVKRTQKPERSMSGRTHDVSLEMFPTVKTKPADIKPCDLPVAQKKQAVKAVPMQVNKVQKGNVCVPVKLTAQEEYR